MLKFTLEDVEKRQYYKTTVKNNNYLPVNCNNMYVFNILWEFQMEISKNYTKI